MPRRRPPNDPPKLRSIAGKPLPHDLTAERAVLSACLLKPEVIDDVAPIVRPADFFPANHGHIWRTILELRADNQAVDIVTVSRRLSERGQLGGVGGTAYLAELCDATPAIHNVTTHATLVADLSKRRSLITVCQELVARGYDTTEPGFESEALRRITTTVSSGRARGVISSAWRRLDPTLLSSPPSPRRWLLRHPTLDGEDCPAGEGDGMLPLGKAGILSAAGGAGKTIALCQLAISVATGRPWLDHYDVGTEGRGGRVLLALAEEDDEEVHRRLYSCADAMRLTEEERRKVAELVVVLPLAGMPVAIVAQAEDGTVDETDELHDLRRHLEAARYRACPRCSVQGDRDDCQTPGCGGTRPPSRGWSLIVLDPLARWAGADTEKDNNAATRFVQAAESLCTVPGRPTVLVAHHSSKDARREGKADSRGVTAITDGFRWEGQMRSLGDVMFKQAKSNYSRPWSGDELRLVRAKGGVLRVPTQAERAHEEHMQEERAADREAKREERSEALVARKMTAILEAVRTAAAPIKARKDLVGLVSGSKNDREAAVTRLLNTGKLIKTEAGYTVALGSNGVSSNRAPAHDDLTEEEHAQLTF